MAAEAAVEVFDHPVEGATKCMAPGCPNWFAKAGNRHRYCKADNCTYRRGSPATRDLELPEGAAAELIRRLQDEESGEVGPEMLLTRRKAVQTAMRAGDMQALWGALVDEAAACVWWADRVHRGGMPRRAAAVVPGAPITEAAVGGTRSVGLVHAVLASHQRTFSLAEHRMNLLWALQKAREELASAEMGVAQMAGGPQEADARVVCDEKRVQHASAEAAYQSAEAAWRERALTLRELSGAAGTAGRPRTAAA